MPRNARLAVLFSFLLHGGFSLIPDPAPEEAFSSVYARKFSGAMKQVHLLTAVKLPVSQ